ncbi:triose-phosphate isomerase, partial [Candidatus Woesearchaeota archaeon]|nr:triose-phosphate isomerase [Candidatus Woesearchaeota archaeon]
MNLIAANWKMNKTVKEALKFFNDLNSKTDEFADNEVLICPSFLALSEISKIKHEKIKLGAQNFYFEDSGAYTGETSLLILKGFCEYVLVGHSER